HPDQRTGRRAGVPRRSDRARPRSPAGRPARPAAAGHRLSALSPRAPAASPFNSKLSTPGRSAPLRRDSRPFPLRPGAALLPGEQERDPMADQGIPLIGPILNRIIGTRNERFVKRYLQRVAAINALEPRVRTMTDAQIRAM